MISSNGAISGDERQEPWPPRYWWTKRIAVAGAVLLAALAGLRLWWGRDAEHRLTDAIAAFHARGEPILPEDSRAEEIPDARNAGYWLNQAAGAMNPAADPPAATNMLYQDYPPMPAEWDAVAAKAVAGNTKALQLARKARSCDRANWGVDISAPGFIGRFLGLNSQRHLANLLGDAALYQHFRGNDAEALELIRDLMHQSWTFDQQPILVGHLVAIGIDALTLNRLLVIAPGLGVRDAAERAQIEGLIRALLDETRRDGLRRAMLGERMLGISNVRSAAAEAFLLRPMRLMGSLTLVGAHEQVIRAATRPTWPQAEAAAPALRASAGPAGLCAWPQMLLMPGYMRAVDTDFRVLVSRRMAAVSLAARLYQVDHAGKWPARLEDLVPRYLPAVPGDPFSPVGGPLKCLLANGGRRPVVYSVREDGADNTPGESVLPAEPQYGWHNGSDQWIDLSRFAPASQPVRDE